MAKDSYWFKHDSTAGRGMRIRKIQHIYGHWGKGVYWDVIETLRDQDGYTFASDDSSLHMMCELIGCKDEVKFLSWYKDCIKFKLFEEKKSVFYSVVLIENMATWETKKENGGKGGRPKKVKPNPTETETITETKPKPKANQKDKIIEEEIIEEDIIKGLIKQDQIWFEQAVLKPYKIKQTMYEEKFDIFWTANYAGHVLENNPTVINDIKRHFTHWLKKQDLKTEQTYQEKHDSFFDKTK